MDRREKLRATMLKKYGSQEEWSRAMREHGSKANRKTPRGFAKIDPERVKEISQLGVESRAKNKKMQDL